MPFGLVTGLAAALAWGTLEPVAAFLIANGRAITRAEAEGRVNDYVAWFRERYVDVEADEQLNPKRLREWCDAQFPSMPRQRSERRSFGSARLSRDFSHTEAAEFPVIALAGDAGILWLTRVAGLNPATSHVIREWDGCAEFDYEMRRELLAIFKQEREARRQLPKEAAATNRLADLVNV